MVSHGIIPADGVAFWGCEQENGTLAGVMGIQPVQDVTLILHAYVRTTNQKQGIGSQLLSHLQQFATTPILIGTWADASWAIHFYQRHGFRLIPPHEKDRLLKKYWSIPPTPNPNLRSPRRFQLGAQT